MIIEGSRQESIYYFDKNTLGDIVAIRDDEGNIVATYSYDAWGNCTVMDEYGYEETSISFIGNINPFRYRGYYYDNETGFYYLQTRYYDPTICRFINADNYELVAQLSSLAGQLNMYAYCGNNPIMYTDPTGTSWFSGIWNVICEIYLNIQADMQKFDMNNTDPQKVIESNYFSAYKGTFVLRLPIGDNAFSFGAIFLGSGLSKYDYDTVRHEYGHRVQLNNLGVWDYTFQVAIPSVTGYLLLKQGKLPINYYSQPWEYEADQLGGVYRGVPLVSITYWNLLKMF